ncbi:unnamed protein product [Allacma fusca]|uniref:FAM13A-like domain-containing protein n=1 Tax=Allacma fusca TaxID=39272 RepID=A0A8J2KC69_9HEXA|nr:unnamed protein product [Allacma fusca]
MFKFRRPSICADLEIVSDSDSVSDVTDEIQKRHILKICTMGVFRMLFGRKKKGVSINSISESRSSLKSEDPETWKKTGGSGEDCDSPSNDSERFFESAEEEARKSHSKDLPKNEVDSAVPSSALGPKHGLSLDLHHAGTLKTETVNNGSSSNCVGTNGSTSVTSTGSAATFAAAIMCDRKRKERHESCSQGQEKKVIRSLSHDDPKLESDVEKGNNFRRTQSNDNFQPSLNASPTGDDETEEGLILELQQQIQSSSCNGKQKSSNTGESKQNQLNNSSGPVDSSLYGVGSAPIPQYGIVRTMPMHFEAELQRQWERSAQWTSSSTRKVHSGGKHRNRSGKSSSMSTPSKDPSDGELEDGRDSDDVTGENVSSFNEDELQSPTSEESSSSSIESLEDIENQEKLSLNLNVSCEDLETDMGEDLDVEQTRLADTSQSHHGLENGNSLKPLPHLDFSTLHHQVETNEPIPFLAALQASGAEDQVMLSPRNSILIKEADPSVPPSPPLHQAILDPPISRQHGGNQNMKMNQLSKQVGNLKKHLKSLEEEYEQLFGYKPSHADKLNQKEMRKCLLQLTKAKRELKQMKEDPANLRPGGSLLQVLNSTMGQPFYSRNSPEALKCLDETVKEINKTMCDKRRSQCRPEDPGLMTQSELTEEKNSMQKQLLMLEKRHGRPGSKEEKEIVRTLYDRYRSLKKTGSRFGNIKENSIDLAPILEYEPLELAPNNSEVNSTSIVELRKESGSGIVSSGVNSPKGRRRRIAQNEDDDYDDGSVINIRNEGFTEMNLPELESRQRLARDEKRRLRTILRKFESDFQNVTGRPPQKDEKYSSAEMETTYQKYKRCRATVRLLDVLISKRKYPQLVDISKCED